VLLLERVRVVRDSGAVDAALLRDGAALTDANAAIFDAAHAFAGCIPGIHESCAARGCCAAPGASIRTRSCHAGRRRRSRG
jgi:hypothetical protein